MSGELYTEDAKNGELYDEFLRRAKFGWKSTLKLLLPYIYEDIFAANFDRVAVNSDCGVGGQFTVRNVVFPTVPRTYDNLAFHFAFAERPTAMQAYIIDCKEFTFDVGYSNVLAVQLKFANRAGRDFVLFRCPQKSHRIVFSVPKALARGKQCASSGSPDAYLGSGDCATITPRLNSSTIPGCKRTAVGRFASDIWSILSCNFNSA